MKIKWTDLVLLFPDYKKITHLEEIKSFTFHYEDGLDLFSIFFQLQRRAHGCGRFKLLSIRTLKEKQKLWENIIHEISNKIKILKLLFEHTSSSVRTSWSGVEVLGKAGGSFPLTKIYTVPPVILETHYLVQNKQNMCLKCDIVQLLYYAQHSHNAYE